VAIEHGCNNTIEANEIRGNLCGVRLWWSPSPIGDDPSENYAVRENTFSKSRQYGVHCLDTRNVEMSSNRFNNNSQDFRQVWEYLKG